MCESSNLEYRDRSTAAVRKCRESRESDLSLSPCLSGLCGGQALGKQAGLKLGAKSRNWLPTNGVFDSICIRQ